jgi:hypothetical protein
MNPTDSTVESIEAGAFRTKQGASRSSLVKTFDDWLKTRDVTFAITFDRYCSDTARAMAYAISH